MAKGNYLYSKVGRRIAYERRRRGWSQHYLAVNTDLDRSYVTKLEGGKINPSLKTLFKIARKMRTKIRLLLRDV